MSRTPYPGYAPSYKVVDETGGFTRNCIILELLSVGKLGPAEMSHIQEQLEAFVAGLSNRMSSVENAKVVLPDQFDPKLREGLRISG